MMRKKVDSLFDDLPPELKRQVEDYIVFLSERYAREIHKNKFKFEWEGFLESIYENHSTLSVQQIAYHLWEETDVPH